MAKKLRIPPETELRSYYEDQFLSTRQIASIYKVDKSTITRWLRGHNITVRPPSQGIIHRGGKFPDPKDLYRFVHIDKLTYPEIATKYGCDPSAVGHWLDKFDIPRPGHHLRYKEQRDKAMSLLPKQVLHDLYINKKLSLRNISNMYGLAESMITWLCKKYHIKRRPEGWNKTRFKCQDGHMVRSSYELRVDNWLYKHKVQHVYDPRLPFDRRYKADFLANNWYIEIWGVVGSKVYKRRKEKKLIMYKANNVPLIEIPVHAFDSSRNRQWERLLSLCFQQPMTSMLPLNF